MFRFHSLWFLSPLKGKPSTKGSYSTGHENIVKWNALSHPYSRIRYANIDDCPSPARASVREGVDDVSSDPSLDVSFCVEDSLATSLFRSMSQNTEPDHGSIHFEEGLINSVTFDCWDIGNQILTGWHQRKRNVIMALPDNNGGNQHVLLRMTKLRQPSVANATDKSMDGGLVDVLDRDYKADRIREILEGSDDPVEVLERVADDFGYQLAPKLYME